MQSPRTGPDSRAAGRNHTVRTRRLGEAWTLPEVRWASLSLVLFLIGLALRVGGGPVWLETTAFLLCYLAGGWEPLLAGLQAARAKSLDVDLLMIVAAIGAAAIGQVLDGGLLIVIFATSGALEAFATKRTQDSVRDLLDLAPERANRVDSAGNETAVDTADLDIGDVIVVRPGEIIGGDGVVSYGSSEVDQASVTGEPMPVYRTVGDDVFASTFNRAGALHVTIVREPSDSVVARIVTMVEEASATKARTQLFIDKIEQRYSVTVVIATLAVFFIPLAFGAELQSTLLRAMTFMIVASPCAVVLATMPPLLSAIANAGRHGVLVKSAVVMEQLGTITRVAFDKTGTLTMGTPRVHAVHSVDSALSEDAVLALAAAAERPSEHPLGRAVVDAATDRGLAIADASDFSSTAGRGVTALVSGRHVAVGSPALLLTGPRHVDAERLAQVEEDHGNTAVVVVIDDVVVGVLSLSDQVRSKAKSTVAELTSMIGTTPTLLTGDNPRAAAQLAAHVGITDVRAALLPQDKVAAVQEMRGAGGRVLVVGDGVNDAPALAAADLGIAMGRHGSDLALQTSDAVIVRDELDTLPAVIDLSHRAKRAVVQNLVLAGVAIVGLIAWDLIGTLPLPLGVLGHEGGTVLIGLNGLRLLRESAWRA